MNMQSEIGRPKRKFLAYAVTVKHGKPFRWSEDYLRDEWIKSLKAEKKRIKILGDFVKSGTRNDLGTDTANAIMSLMKPGKSYTSQELQTRCEKAGRRFALNTVRNHLNKLVGAGSVKVSKECISNQPKLFTLAAE